MQVKMNRDQVIYWCAGASADNSHSLHYYTLSILWEMITMSPQTHTYTHTVYLSCLCRHHDLHHMSSKHIPIHFMMAEHNCLLQWHIYYHLCCPWDSWAHNELSVIIPPPFHLVTSEHIMSYLLLSSPSLIPSCDIDNYCSSLSQHTLPFVRPNHYHHHFSCHQLTTLPTAMTDVGHDSLRMPAIWPIQKEQAWPWA
jgi:hypothetical protein